MQKKIRRQQNRDRKWNARVQEVRIPVSPLPLPLPLPPSVILHD